MSMADYSNASDYADSVFGAQAKYNDPDNWNKAYNDAQEYFTQQAIIEQDRKFRQPYIDQARSKYSNERNLDKFISWLGGMSHNYLLSRAGYIGNAWSDFNNELKGTTSINGQPSVYQEEKWGGYKNARKKLGTWY